VLLKADVLPVVSYANMSIVNVSRTGFAGETMTPLRATDLLIFSIVGNRFHQGSVRWVRGPKFGIDLVDLLAPMLYIHHDSPFGETKKPAATFRIAAGSFEGVVLAFRSSAHRFRTSPVRSPR